MLNILREKGLNFENVNLDKDVETLKGIIASRTNGHHNLLNNANLYIDQFQKLLEIKKKILISELDLILTSQKNLSLILLILVRKGPFYL